MSRHANIGGAQISHLWLIPGLLPAQMITDRCCTSSAEQSRGSNGAAKAQRGPPPAGLTSTRLRPTRQRRTFAQHDS
eukprot:6198040-Pleurochrysis_carterae.AAC.1